MKLSLIGSFLAAGLLWAGASSAFEPLPHAEAKSFVGKTVYLASNQSIGQDAWVYAGEPVTLVEAKVFQDGRYNFLKVRTAAGAVGEVQIRYLSKAPLAYNLKNPGTPSALIKTILDDAFPLGAKMHAMHEKYGALSNDRPDEYHLFDSTQESFTFSRMLLHNLVYGANISKTDLLGQGDTKWLATADETLTNWFSDGMPEKSKLKYRNAVNALDELDNVGSMELDIDNRLKERVEKPWQRNLKNIPEARRAKIDNEKMAEIDKEVADRKKKIAAMLASAAKLKATIK